MLQIDYVYNMWGIQFESSTLGQETVEMAKVGSQALLRDLLLCGASHWTPARSLKFCCSVCVVFGWMMLKPMFIARNPTKLTCDIMLILYEHMWAEWSQISGIASPVSSRVISLIGKVNHTRRSWKHALQTGHTIHRPVVYQHAHKMRLGKRIRVWQRERWLQKTDWRKWSPVENARLIHPHVRSFHRNSLASNFFENYWEVLLVLLAAWSVVLPMLRWAWQRFLHVLTDTGITICTTPLHLMPTSMAVAWMRWAQQVMIGSSTDGKTLCSVGV